MRTAIRALSEREGISIRWDAPEEGFLYLEAECAEEGREFLSAAGAFLLEGLASVAEERPECCSMTVRRI
jgi:hypothetical protein